MNTQLCILFLYIYILWLGLFSLATARVSVASTSKTHHCWLATTATTKKRKNKIKGNSKARDRGSRNGPDLGPMWCFASLVFQSQFAVAAAARTPHFCSLCISFISPCLAFFFFSSSTILLVLFREKAHNTTNQNVYFDLAKSYEMVGLGSLLHSDGRGFLAGERELANWAHCSLTKWNRAGEHKGRQYSRRWDDLGNLEM